MPTLEKQNIVCKSRFRIKNGNNIALGPGKIELLEAIELAGSISAAAREIGLSYKRAWEMVDVTNRCFQSPLVERSAGGHGGGGANLTPLGLKMVGLYRTMETKAEKIVVREWVKIQQAMKKTNS